MSELKRRIYALPAELMPEVKAVTFAKCSRSPESFDEIAKELTEENSADFHEKWIVGYGHSSVAEHAVLSLAMENVSILATKVIEDTRLASFTEKSTRYQIFNRDKVYKPGNVLNSSMGKVYQDATDLLMDVYEELSEPMRKFVEKKYPREKDQSEKLYNMISKARACDNIRYLLPTAITTNLGMTINARGLEHLIKKLLSHDLEEMRAIGEEIKEKGVTEVPTLIRYAQENEYFKETRKALRKTGEEYAINEAGDNTAVKIIDYDKNAEDKIITSLLYPHGQLSYSEIMEKVMGMSEKEKENVLEESLKRRGKFDAPLREFEHIYYTFEILVDYGAFRDIQRHRMCTQTNQNVTTVHGYDMPPEIKEAGLDGKFRKAVEEAAAAFEEIYKEFPQEAQYVVPLCFRKRVLITWNLRELFHFISLRSGKKGHASYRRIAQECWRQLEKIHPLFAKYINVDMDDMDASWAATLENKEYYYNPFANRKKGKN